MTTTSSDPHQVSKLTRFFSSVSTQLQFTMLMLSVVGLVFGFKSYFHVKHSFGIAAGQDFLNDLWIQIAIAIVVNLVSGFIVLKVVTRRIVTLCEVMRKLTEGHYEVEVPYSEKACEIGSMARKVKIFQENGISLKKMERERIETDKRREFERKQLLGKIADDFTSKIKNIVEMVTNSARILEESCEKMVKSSDSSYDKIQHLNTEALSASSNVNTVASASEELSASIKSISYEVIKSANITKDAVRKAEDVKQVVNNLSGSAEKIGSVIGIINDIAEQINLLALNATIEAARAGDAGKGFAVVASEVKNLANQTAKATDEINAIITSMQNETKTSVASIVDVSTTIAEINNVATVISASISQQTTSTQDIAHNVHSAAEHTNSVSDNMVNIAHISKENSSSAAQMLQSSVKLLDHTKTLGLELDKFINTLRNS